MKKIIEQRIRTIKKNEFLEWSTIRFTLPITYLVYIKFRKILRYQHMAML